MRKKHSWSRMTPARLQCFYDVDAHLHPAKQLLVRELLMPCITPSTCSLQVNPCCCLFEQVGAWVHPWSTETGLSYLLLQRNWKATAFGLPALIQVPICSSRCWLCNGHRPHCNNFFLLLRTLTHGRTTLLGAFQGPSVDQHCLQGWCSAYLACETLRMSDLLS